MHFEVSKNRYYLKTNHASGVTLVPLINAVRKR